MIYDFLCFLAAGIIIELGILLGYWLVNSLTREEDELSLLEAYG